MFAVIFIPDFFLQAVLRHEPELIARPAALTDPELVKLGIIQLTTSARMAGVCEGMTASQAMGRCADLVIKSRAPAQEQSAMEVLMQTAYAFSPFIESTGPGICTIELRGLRAQQDETAARQWAEEIRKVLSGFYLDGRIGFAVTPELALLAAAGGRYGGALPPHPGPLPKGEGECQPAHLHMEHSRPCPTNGPAVGSPSPRPQRFSPERVIPASGSHGARLPRALSPARTRSPNSGSHRALPNGPPSPGGEGWGELPFTIHNSPVSIDSHGNGDVAVTATAALRNGPVQIVTDIAEFASGLPIRMLGLTGEMLDILKRWGIRTAGALLALGKDAVVARLGPEAIEVFERFSPDSIRPLKIASLPETFAEQMEFENPIETLEPLLFVLRRFTEQLSRRIELLYLVVAELHLKLGLASGATYESVFKVPSPTGNAEILFRMLHTHLENVRTDAPISSLWLAAKPGRPEAHQFGLFETTLRNPNQFAETLARLEALCGPNRVGTPCLEPTLKPDSFRMKRAEFYESERKKRSASKASRARSVRACGPRAVPCVGLSSKSNQTRKVGRAVLSAPPNTGCDSNFQTSNDFRSRSAGFQPAVSQGFQPADRASFLENLGKFEGSADWKSAIQQVGNLRSSAVSNGRTIARPAMQPPIQHGLQLRRFRPAVTARVEFREQEPVLIRSAVCNGAIVKWRGPFLNSGNWWDDRRWGRQEWDVQMADGRMYRIFRTGERSRRGDQADLGKKSASSPRRLQVPEVSTEECFVEGVYD